jgi:hypothetical protein
VRRRSRRDICRFVKAADGIVLYVRTSGDPARAIGTAQREVRAMDAQVPLENAPSVDEVIDQSLWLVKIAAGLLAVFGELALASVGLYGLSRVFRERASARAWSPHGTRR